MRAPVHLGRVTQTGPAAVRGGEFIPRVERLGVISSAEALVIADHPVQDGDRVT